MPEKAITAAVGDIAFTAGIASLGGAAHYLYRYSNGAPFKFMMFLINVFLAGFVGTIVGPLIQPGDFQYACISISGFSSMYILGFLEHKGGVLIINAILRSLKLPELPVEESKKDSVK